VRTRTLRPSRRLGGNCHRILPLPLSTALKIGNSLAGTGAGSHSGQPQTSVSTHSNSTSGMIIPNKSTIAEEDIQVLYGRDSGSTAVEERGHDRGVDMDVDVDAEAAGGGVGGG